MTSDESLNGPAESAQPVESADPRSPADPEAPVDPVDWRGALVIEDHPEPPRTHRASDVLRLVLTLSVGAALVFAGSVGSETTAGLQEDITTAVTSVPALVISILATLNNLIVLVLPLYLVIDLMIRRRWRLFTTSLLAAAIGLVAASLVNTYSELFLSGVLEDSLIIPVGGAAATPVAFGVFSSVVALVTVEGSAARSRTQIAVWASLVGLGMLFLVDRRATPLALALSVLGGHAIGLIVRYVAGTENPRASSMQIAEALARVGVVPKLLRQLHDNRELGRTYDLETVDGRSATVQLLDPDRRTRQLLTQFTRVVRVRTWVTRTPGLSDRAQIQQSVVPVLMANDAGVRSPRLLAAVEVDDETSLFAEEKPPGLRPLVDMSPEEISDQTLNDIWVEIRRLHHAGIAHEGINPASFALDEDGHVWVLGLNKGEIAAPRLRMRLDRAELLVATALLVGADRAIAAALAVIGDEDLANLPALLQPVALNAATRLALKNRGDMLESLRDAAIAQSPTPTADPVKLERLRPRTLVSLIALTFAVYVLAGQLGNVDFSTVFSDVEWAWAAGALAASALTYLGSAWTIMPFSPVRIPMSRWLAAQFAATFVTLVAPAAVGSAGTNARLIQRAGVPSGLALASVGVSTLVSFVTTAIAVVAVTLASSQSSRVQIETPSDGVLIGVAAVLLVIVVAFVVPISRRVIVERLRPTWENTAPRLLDVVRDPKRLLGGVGGNLVTSIAYALTLYLAVRAYGESISVPAAVVVYLTAHLLGTVAPTPGGIGAVEAALIAGLSAFGVPGNIALPAALLYRTVTFWVPTVPGWFTFQWLQRVEAI